jgi:general secretion pathway protein I
VTSRRARESAGFTLIEVMVALAIVAVTLAAGLRASGAVTGNAQRLADVTAAQWCADNQLTGLRLARQFPGVGDGEFTCDQLGRTFKGVMRTRPTPNPNFRRVDAIVADESGYVLLNLSTVLGRF